MAAPELPEKFVIDLELDRTTTAELVSFIPGVVRSGETTVRTEVHTADDMIGSSSPRTTSPP